MVGFWFRRDLRLEDNAGLYQALKSGQKVQCFFLFDAQILDRLEDRDDARVSYIHQRIQLLQSRLRSLGSDLVAEYGTAEEKWKEWSEQYSLTAVYTNHDYEPQAIRRDKQISELLASKSIGFHTFKDQVIFEKSEVVKDDGKPYTVFTPYSRKWKAKLKDFYLSAYPSEKYLDNLNPGSCQDIPSLASMRFSLTSIELPTEHIEEKILQQYDKTRDIPGIRGTSRLGLALRFGSISIRSLAKKANGLNETYLNELIWRDFYQQILWHFPHVAKSAFKPAYDHIPWRNSESDFAAWCEGRTGYPIVDAGMRELKATGFMHNRVRMICASFLTKHLLLDWRLGEAWFARHLLDFDLAANNGGWQWAAGTGCDAAPYFRVFNPSEQTRKFDPDAKYIRKWVPEFFTGRYIQPIVDHKFARERALDTYKNALATNE